MNTTKEKFVERRRRSCRGGSRKFCEKMGRKGKKNKNKKVCGRERIHEEMSPYQIDSTRMEAGEHVGTTTGW
jgi:hypothetical protein